MNRRDFLHGAALGAASTASLVSPPAWSNTPHSGAAARSGATVFGGQGERAMGQMHALRDGQIDLDRAELIDHPEVLDAIVVGGGISGLAGAWWIQEAWRRTGQRPLGPVLVLEADSTLGGHARADILEGPSGPPMTGYAGSQSLDSPSLFSAATMALLQGVGIDLKVWEQGAFDSTWHERMGLKGQGWFFPQSFAATGSGHSGAAGAFVRPWLHREKRHGDDGHWQWIQHTPLPARVKQAWLRLNTSNQDVLPHLDEPAKRSLLSRWTYRRFLQEAWSMPEVLLQLLQHETEDYLGAGIDAVSALDAWALGMPGFSGLKLAAAVDPRMSASARQLFLSQDPYIYHFPDGNAGVVRAILRSLGDRVDARVNHPVLRVRHPDSNQDVAQVWHLDEQGRLHLRKARKVLLACWSRVAARICPELPAQQREALNDQVRVPLVYANVRLKQWAPWQRAQVSSLRQVGGFWPRASLDFPVRMEGSAPPESADRPILVHLSKVVLDRVGSPPREQAAAGRHRLMSWSFEHFEKGMTDLLEGALGPFGFKADRDVEAFHVHRWAHGYAWEYMRPGDRYWPQGPLPCESARQGWGCVAIAGTDAGAYAYAHSAMDQAARAVSEWWPQANIPRGHPRPGPDLGGL